MFLDFGLKCFATRDMPQKLPTLLDHLEVLNLSGLLCFAREVELCSPLLLVTSSPNIQTIIMKVTCYRLYSVILPPSQNKCVHERWMQFRKCVFIDVLINRMTVLTLRIKWISPLYN